MSEARFLPSADGIELRSVIDLPGGLRRAGYRQGLRQILTNLVGNATKFTQGGSVVVHVRQTLGSGVQFEVRDTGFGIPPEAQARIFEPYEQADSSTLRRFGGTGLGLAICAEITRRMDGRIGVDSKEGEGAAFWLEVDLPVDSAPTDQSDARTGRAGPFAPMGTAMQGDPVRTARAPTARAAPRARGDPPIIRP